jgi:hypothetical protein
MSNHSLGFGQKARIDEINMNNKMHEDRIWKKLYNPEFSTKDPEDPTRVTYNPIDFNKMHAQVILTSLFIN